MAFTPFDPLVLDFSPLFPEILARTLNLDRQVAVVAVGPAGTNSENPVGGGARSAPGIGGTTARGNLNLGLDRDCTAADVSVGVVRLGRSLDDCPIGNTSEVGHPVPAFALRRQRREVDRAGIDPRVADIQLASSAVDRDRGSQVVEVDRLVASGGADVDRALTHVHGAARWDLDDLDEEIADTFELTVGRGDLDGKSRPRAGRGVVNDRSGLLVEAREAAGGRLLDPEHVDVVAVRVDCAEDTKEVKRSARPDLDTHFATVEDRSLVVARAATVTGVGEGDVERANDVRAVRPAGADLDDLIPVGIVVVRDRVAGDRHPSVSEVSRDLVEAGLLDVQHSGEVVDARVNRDGAAARRVVWRHDHLASDRCCVLERVGDRVLARRSARRVVRTADHPEVGVVAIGAGHLSSGVNRRPSLSLRNGDWERIGPDQLEAELRVGDLVLEAGRAVARRESEQDPQGQKTRGAEVAHDGHGGGVGEMMSRRGPICPLVRRILTGATSFCIATSLLNTIPNT